MSILEIKRIKKKFWSINSNGKKLMNIIDLGYLITLIIIHLFQDLKIILFWFFTILLLLGHVIFFFIFKKRLKKQDEEVKNLSITLIFFFIGRFLLLFAAMIIEGAFIYENFYLFLLAIGFLFLSGFNYIKQNPKYIKLYLERYIVPIVFFSFCFLIISGVIFTFLLSKELNFISSQSLMPFFSLLIGLLISIFGISLTIYSLILKLTKGETISDYMQDDLKIRKFCIVYLMMVIIQITTYLIFFIFDIYTNILSVLFIVIFPMIIIIGFALGTQILKILSATSIKGSIKFFTDNSDRLKEECYNLYYFNLKSSKNEKTYFTKYFKSIRNTTTMRSVVKKFQDQFDEILEDAIILIKEIQDKSKPINPKLFHKIAKSLVPPYTSQDFIYNHFMVLLKRYIEDFPKYRMSYIHFINGYIEGILDSDFLDNIMLSGLELILREMILIGSDMSDGTFKSVINIDEKNKILYTISKKIVALKIKDDNLALESTRGMILKTIVDTIAKKDYRYEILAYDFAGKLDRLNQILELEKSLKIKKHIFDAIIYVLQKILDNPQISFDTNFSYYFSSIWNNYLTLDFFRNPYTINTSIDKYARNINEKILIPAKNSVFRSIEESIGISSSYLSQIHRVYVDLAFHLSNLYTKTSKSSKSSKSSFHDNIKDFSHVIFEDYFKFIEDIRNSEYHVDFRYLMGAPIIIGAVLTSSIENFKTFLRDKIPQDKNGIIIVFGIIVILKEFFKNDLDKFHWEKELLNNTKNIKEAFLINSKRDDMYLGSENDIYMIVNSINCGVEAGGNMVGVIVFEILETISNKETIQKYLDNLNQLK